MNLKDRIIYEDLIMGEITIQDLIHFLTYLLKETNQNLEILDGILKDTNLEKEDITSFRNKFDLSSYIKFMIDVLSENL